MKLRRILLLMLLLINGSACALFNNLESISIVGPTEVDINEGVALSVETKPKNASKQVVWESSNEAVAAVDEEGYLTGISAGQAVISATSVDFPDIFGTLTVTIVEPTIESVVINGRSTVYKNGKITLLAIVFPEHASQEVEFTSLNEQIATVDENGVVFGLALGKATIRAISKANEDIYIDFEVFVIEGNIDSVSIEGESETEIDTVLELKAIFDEVDVTSEFLWTSSDEEVATVENGKVTPMKQGTTMIRASYKNNPAVFDEKEITVIVPEFRYFQSKLLRIDRNAKRIELLNCPSTVYDENTEVVRKTGDTFESASLDDLFVGMENLYAKVKYFTNTISKIVIDGETGFSNIRVAIRNSIDDISKDETLYHSSIIFTLNAKATLKTFNGSKTVSFESGTTISITTDGEKMTVKKGTEVLLETPLRIIISTTAIDDGIKFASISRGSSELYSGNMEVSLVNGKLLAINDIDLEKYLYKVVPSEMPSGYNFEALKAQAIAARTYAYRDIFNKTYEHLGYTVDDSVKSQVYNNTHAAPATTNAVNSTKGLVMMSNGELASVFYYSTSSGLTASAHEVWIDNAFTRPEPIPYLIGQNLTKDANGNPVQFDYQNEASMLAFFKNTSYVFPDSNITSYARWHFTFTKTELAKTLQVNLKKMYESAPNLILTKTESGGWESKTIPTSIGEVLDIYVSERGQCGVVISLTIETTSGIYKIVNQYNIRFTIRPEDAGIGSASVLYSGFFAIEKSGTNYTFYGGGNGHGVGMSQNAANSLGKSGYSYQEILSTFYQETDYVDIGYSYTPISDYKQYFE